ncbi:MAG: PDZ domain-containing protein [Phycisphaerales bacterium]|nr:PDZ domain-containing protein [Phycisphaerales bacterium]
MRLRSSSSVPMLAMLAVGTAAMLLAPVAAAQVRVDAKPRFGNGVKQIRSLGSVGSIDGLDVKSLRRSAIPDLVADKVVQLGSGSFEDRENATASLRSMPVADEILMAVLEQGGLDEEQRNRMLGVLRWRVLHRPRGAVGIRMEPAATGIRGVLVTEVIKDLPAERVLRVGDVILEINGAGLATSSDLISKVQRLQPGDQIRMKVLRPVPADTPDAPGIVRLDRDRAFEEVDVEFLLGSYEKLGNDPTASALGNPETMRRRSRVEAIWARWGTDAASVGVVPPLVEPEKSPSTADGP